MKKKLKLFSKLDMSEYKPSEKSLNQAVWGKDEAPTPEDLKKSREEMNDKLEELRNLGKKKDR